ncbi:unnamed protein product [Ixodes persulcatus]
MGLRGQPRARSLASVLSDPQPSGLRGKLQSNGGAGSLLSAAVHALILGHLLLPVTRHILRRICLCHASTAKGRLFSSKVTQ